MLVIDPDEDAVADLVGRLRRYDLDVESVHTAEEALKRYSRSDMIVLEPDLPDIDGLELCGTIRTMCNVPIIVVSTRDSAADRVLALRAGADDCLTKPYWLPELLARMATVIRRTDRSSVRPPRRLDRGPLRIDLQRRELHVRGKKVKLTRKEFDLLSVLAAEPHVVVSRQELASQVWHGTCSARSRTIDTHISGLRSKLGSDTSITAVRGVGFRLSYPAPEGPGSDHGAGTDHGCGPGPCRNGGSEFGERRIGSA